jgi:hypothetical protein
MRVVTEEEFYRALTEKLIPFINWGKPNSYIGPTPRAVMGPGRSGAVASVYASHFLGAIWLPPTMGRLPSQLRPLMVIDTAAKTGATIRKIQRRFEAEYSVVLFDEPPLLRFWYENVRPVEIELPESGGAGGSHG